MMRFGAGRVRVVAVCTVWMTLGVWAQKPVSEATIKDEIGKLRATPDDKRGAVTAQIALEIRALPAGIKKLGLADGLSHLATEGDPGKANLQEVATTLAAALNENPMPAKGDKPAGVYLDLARLVRYEGMKAEVSDPQFAKAMEVLAANDAEVETIDFTLKDWHGKKVTKSEFKGKIVLVNFWATWCPPCRKELPDLDAIAKHFAKQGLVVLTITDEDLPKVYQYWGGASPSFMTLLDPGRKVATEFHVDGIPHTFVFDREGKLSGQGIDMRTQRQFLMMLGKAGLKPE